MQESQYNDAYDAFNADEANYYDQGARDTLESCLGLGSWVV